MPKAAKRTRAGAHAPSVKVAKRSFAVQENAVEHVEIGTAPEAPANDILESLETEESKTTITKKEKHALKREAFLQKLDISKSPYSKSHNRRVKRKAKEQIASGMSDMQQALAALEDPLDTTEQETSSKKSGGKDAMDTDLTAVPRPTASSKSMKIGEGKGVTLSKSQRKRVLELERLRQPMILTNPTYADNPFSTIRLHAQNTLLKHQTPS
ncbi:ribosome biogenesis protein SLX9-domain-containing protein [Ephemerocybe angulata]|uniref:Ribosome biogenesis protein SLX9 n=1 Tax=Ephemerocybe angulata TaxID=980116 RepID=A0A8H6IIY4_9AGAR|nr:ribosome biogenesis protein SLX9-domain-containing protein [Tulosesus angulatus]